MAPIALVVFLVLLFFLYLTMSKEQQEYDQIEDVIEGDETDTDYKNNHTIWKGKIEGFPITIMRGLDFKDSNRLITIAVSTDTTANFRMDLSNILRRPLRFLSEFLGNRKKVDFEGPLSRFIIYTTEPRKAEEILAAWNTEEATKKLSQFHNFTFERNYIKGWFYQVDVNLEEIRQQAETFVELLKPTELKPGDPDADPLPPRY